MTRNLLGTIHLWVGLILCAPLVALGLTGSVLVFEDELRDLLGPQSTSVGQLHPVGEIVEAARKVAPPGFAPALYVAPRHDGAFATVRLTARGRGGDGPGGEPLTLRVDPVSLAVAVEDGGILRQVFLLHSTLLLKNRVGRQIVGWLGVAMVVLGVSGVVNWWPRPGRWRAAFGVARGARGALLYRELHGAAGIWGLAVFLTVSVAGVYLAFPESVREAVVQILPARDLRAAAAALEVHPVPGEQPMPIDQAVALALSSVGEANLAAIMLPGRPNQPIRIAFAAAGESRGVPLTTVFVDPWERKIVTAQDPRDFTAGETLLAWQHSLHAGRGLGWVWKILVCLSGLLPSLFATTGILLWSRKRRSRRIAEARRVGVAV